MDCRLDMRVVEFEDGRAGAVDHGGHVRACRGLESDDAARPGAAFLDHRLEDRPAYRQRGARVHQADCIQDAKLGRMDYVIGNVIQG